MLPEYNEAVPVNRISDEYAYIAVRPCPACGGRWKVRIQALLQDAQGRHYDQLDVMCSQCGTRKAFLFDIESAFEQYPRG